MDYSYRHRLVASLDWFMKESSMKKLHDKKDKLCRGYET